MVASENLAENKNGIKASKFPQECEVTRSGLPGQDSASATPQAPVMEKTEIRKQGLTWDLFRAHLTFQLLKNKLYLCTAV